MYPTPAVTWSEQDKQTSMAFTIYREEHDTMHANLSISLGHPQSFVTYLAVLCMSVLHPGTFIRVKGTYNATSRSFLVTAPVEVLAAGPPFLDRVSEAPQPIRSPLEQASTGAATRDLLAGPTMSGCPNHA
jgi:hypothetical protein